MARPARTLWVTRTYARRRHRTWMRSMILASVGWGFWWLHLCLLRFAPPLCPDPLLTSVVAGSAGTAGFLMAVLAVRGTRSWLLFVAVPLLANASLLLFPWLLWEFLSGAG